MSRFVVCARTKFLCNDSVLEFENKIPINNSWHCPIYPELVVCRWREINLCNVRVVKGELINMSWVWDKEKILTGVPDRNQNHDLPNTRWVLYPLSYNNSWRARSFNLRPIYTVRLCPTRQVYHRRTTFSLAKLNMQKFAPGFTERKF